MTKLIQTIKLNIFVRINIFISLIYSLTLSSRSNCIVRTTGVECACRDESAVAELCRQTRRCSGDTFAPAEITKSNYRVIRMGRKGRGHQSQTRDFPRSSRTCVCVCVCFIAADTSRLCFGYVYSVCDELYRAVRGTKFFFFFF